MAKNTRRNRIFMKSQIISSPTVINTETLTFQQRNLAYSCTIKWPRLTLPWSHAERGVQNLGSLLAQEPNFNTIRRSIREILIEWHSMKHRSVKVMKDWATVRGGRNWGNTITKCNVRSWKKTLVKKIGELLSKSKVSQFVVA